MKNSVVQNQVLAMTQNSRQNSALDVIMGKYVAPIYGQAQVSASEAIFSDTNTKVWASIMAVLVKQGYIFSSTSVDGAGNASPDFQDVGDNSTNEELYMPMLNYVTTDGIAPAVFEDNATRSLTFPALGTPKGIQSTLNKAIAVVLRMVRIDNLKNVSLEVTLTNTTSVGPAVQDIFVKKYSANVNTGALVIPAMNFSPRYEQTAVVSGDNTNFTGILDTQNRIAVAVPSLIVPTDGTKVGLGISIDASNCIVYVNVIPYTIGCISDMLGFASMANSVRSAALVDLR